MSGIKSFELGLIIILLGIGPAQIGIDLIKVISQSRQALPSGPAGLQQPAVACEVVQHRHLELLVAQQHSLVLGVDVNET